MKCIDGKPSQQNVIAGVRRCLWPYIQVDYFQVLAIFAASDIRWPKGILTVLNFLSVFNFNIDVATPECLIPNFEYKTKWLFSESLPLALFAGLPVGLQIGAPPATIKSYEDFFSKTMRKKI